MMNKKEQRAVRKALLQQKMAAKRALIKPKLIAVLNTGQRLGNLFNNNNLATEDKKRTTIITAIALLLALLGKKRGGWLGASARYLIINYPGLLRRFIK